MLVEWWQTIRGFSNWTEACAVIQSVSTWAPPRTRIRQADLAVDRTLIKTFTIEYSSSEGLIHHKTFSFVPNLCPILSALEQGDDFWLQYCPNDPEKLRSEEHT